MMEWAWALGVSLGVALLLNFLRSMKRGSRNLPPGPRGWPVIGNIFDIDRAAHRTLDALATKYGPVIWLRLGAVNLMVVSSAEAAMDMFSNHDIPFAGRATNDASKLFSFNEASMGLAPYGPYWRMVRRISYTESFTNKSLNRTESLRREGIEKMLKWMWDEAQLAGTVGVARFVSIMSFNVISNIALSKDLVDPNSKDGEEFFKAVSHGIELGGEPNIADFFLFLRWLDPQGIIKKIKHFMTPVHNTFAGYVKERVLERQQNGCRQNTNKDYLDVLLDFQGNVNEGEPAKLPEKNIVTLLLELFISSTDSTSSTVEWAMTELLRNPGTMGKVQAELDQVVGRKRKVAEEDVANLPYLQAVVKEILRLHPALPLLLPRRAVEDTQFRSYSIPKDTQIFVNVWAIGRDPSSWDDPLSFKPERFLRSDVDYQGRQFHYIPFGAGRRTCAGMSFAKRAVHIALASMLQSYDWALPPDISPGNMDMIERLGVALRKADPLKVVMKMRSSQSAPSPDSYYR